MNIKKLPIFKIATFLIALAPTMIQSRSCLVLFVGEPELPAKMQHKKMSDLL